MPKMTKLIRCNKKLPPISNQNLKKLAHLINIVFIICIFPKTKFDFFGPPQDQTSKVRLFCPPKTKIRTGNRQTINTTNSTTTTTPHSSRCPSSFTSEWTLLEMQHTAALKKTITYFKTKWNMCVWYPVFPHFWLSTRQQLSQVFPSQNTEPVKFLWTKPIIFTGAMIATLANLGHLDRRPRAILVAVAGRNHQPHLPSQLVQKRILTSHLPLQILMRYRCQPTEEGRKKRRIQFLKSC